MACRGVCGRRAEASEREVAIASIRRIAVITLGLAAVGGIVGALLGALLITPIIALVGRNSLREAPSMMLFAAGFGGALGLVLAPLAAWTLMRHVPIWRAILETALGTTIGVGAGFGLLALMKGGLILPIALGIIGFVAAALRLRFAHRPSTRTPPP